MDKYEFNVKVEQMKKLVDEQDYPTAMKIADSIDWGRVRNTNLLSMAAAIYEENGEIQEAKDKLLLAFERAPIGKRLLYKLTELSVKSGDLEEAEDYYHEFQDLAPDDIRSCLLAYLILKARGASPAELAEPLERYTAVEPDERWLYELAEVYDKAGRGADCVSVCDKVALLFGAGSYSEKALRLKQRYTGLSAYQQGIVEDSIARESAARLARAGAARPNTAVRTAVRVSAPQEVHGAETDAALPPLEEDRAGDILANQRYENEDAAFEAYVRLHRLDEPEDMRKKQEEKAYGAVMPEHSLSPEDSYLNDGFADQLSEEVGRLSAEKAADTVGNGATAESEDASGQTRILDEAHVERLRKVIIRDDHLAEEPKIVTKDAETAKAGAMKQAAALAGSLGAAAKQAEVVLQEKQQAAQAAAVLDAAVAATAPKSDEAPRPSVPAATAAAQTMPKKPTPQARPTFTHGTENERPKAAVQPETVKQPEAVPQPAAAHQTQAGKPSMQQEQAKPSAADKALSSASAPVKAPEKTYHMVIEAATAEDGLAIAIDELKYIHREQGITHAAAKTTAQKLNQKGLGQAALDKIRGKDFIVEHAGALEQETAEQIEKLMRTDHSGMIIVLIDVPEGLDRLEETCPALFEHCDLVSDFEEEDEADEAEAPADAADEDASYDDTSDDDAYEDASHEDDAAFDDRDADEGDALDEPDAFDDSDSEDRDAVYDTSYELEDESEPEEEQPAKRTKHGSSKQAVSEKKQSNVKAYVPSDENEEMELDDFAQYCCQFASEIDCSITGKSMLALYERIELMEEDNIPLTRKTAEDLIEEAADRAEKPPIGKRLKGLFSSKYDKNGLLILKEEDFIY